MDHVEVPLFGKYSHLKCKLDKDWYQMICVDGGLRRFHMNIHGYVYFQFHGKDKTESDKLHQLIMNNKGYPHRNNLVIDHIDGNKLDNRRSNLRVITQGENRVGFVSMRKDNKTGIRGFCKIEKKNSSLWHIYFSERCKLLYNKKTANYEDAKAIAEFHNLIRDL